MAEMLASISEEVRARLRGLSARAEDVFWPTPVAQRLGWPAANELYHAEQRMQGRKEMERLLAALALKPPLTPAALREVVQAAAAVYLHTDATSAAARADEQGVRVDVSRCPLFERFGDPSWKGVTACGCFSRLDGWYEALGVPPEVELLCNRKWDDPVCAILLHLPAGRAEDSVREPAAAGPASS